MGSPGRPLILLLLLLILIQDHKKLLAFGNIRKLGRCPRVTIKCVYKEARECAKDRHCKGPEKCCMYSCGKKCLDPKEVAVRLWHKHVIGR
ncbi:eppin-like [Macrotis lagotis]|uniref:eppin-like n=1 Tax=Macrotis lagotis TaxID=92651 RepID=UPI003D69605E